MSATSRLLLFALCNSLALCPLPHVRAAEGMWTLDNLPLAALQSQYQFTPDKAWVDKVMHASLRLAQGCSGSFVSPTGLVLTNHHCAERCIEGLSTKSHDYIVEGFSARAREKEQRCPELELNQLQTITDVTATIKAATQGKTGAAFRPALNAATAKLTADCVGNQRDTVRCDVVELYHGGRYHLYQYHRYQDVRLVWAPEIAAAFFGGDPDNFNFPRYALDASILRAYENGQPVASRDYFVIKPSGAMAGELTFTLGHPGTTQRELTVAELETLRDLRLPRALFLVSELRGVLEQYRQSGNAAQRASYGDFYSIENSFKSYHGQHSALLDPALLEQMRQREQQLQQYVASQPALAATTSAWSDIERAERVNRVINNRYYFLETSRGFQSRFFTMARTLVRGAAERAKPDADRLSEFNEAGLPATEQTLFSPAPIYPEYEKLKLAWSLTKLREWLGADDPLVRKVLGKESPAQVAARVIDNSKLADVKTRRALWDNPASVTTSNDAAIQLALLVDDDARAIRKRYEDEVESVEQRAGQAIAEARFAMTGTGAYPDATFTLRLSFGEVRGWQQGETSIAPFTTFAGAFQRHTGADPFALPASWLRAQSKININMATPFDFVTTNDIVGGNSGSPVINRNAELVGLIFDGNLLSLGGAFGYNETVNRAVAVHAGALIEALRNVYGANDLAQELTVQ
jgi:hypothetical protein